MGGGDKLVKTVAEARNIPGLQFGFSLGVRPTFSLLEQVPTYYAQTTFNYSIIPLKKDDYKDDRVEITAAMKRVEEFTNLKFQEVSQSMNSDGTSIVGDITFGRYDEELSSGIQKGFIGHTRLFGPLRSDVWLPDHSSGGNTWWHELGHALGLDHPLPSFGQASGPNRNCNRVYLVNCHRN